MGLSLRLKTMNMKGDFNMRYLNMRTNHGVETVDELNLKSFKSYREFKQELRRLINEYHLAGMRVYSSTRPDKTWNK